MLKSGQLTAFWRRETFLPYQFTELPVREHLTFYWHGVERVVTQDAYAGLMVSMHCEGLYNRRYGIDPGVSAPKFTPEEQALVQEFRDRLEAQQRQLRERLRAEGAPAKDLEDRSIRVNYKLLQIYDRLSLYLCMPPLEQASLRPAPVNYGGREVELTLQPADAAIRLLPYPFAVDPLRVTVPARLIPNRRYDSDGELRDALAHARTVTREFTLTAS